MLNIYYGREDLCKENFIFDKLNLRERNLIIVPDQFTLSMERDMFDYLKEDSLIFTEITSFSKLGSTLLNELGGADKTFLDKYGRHMLLSKIARENEKSLTVYKGLSSRSSFINLANDFISELKQDNISLEDLNDILLRLKDDKYSYNKLSDLKLIYSIYEDEIKDKYVDSEDKIELYTKKIKKSLKLRDTNIYIYGFDSIAHKTMAVISELIAFSKSVNVILSYEDGNPLFTLTGVVLRNLSEEAKRRGVPCYINEISKDYLIKDRALGIQNIEKYLYSDGILSDLSHKGVYINSFENIYKEADNVASFVLHLIRDEGYSLNDIKIILNDEDCRMPILKRTFRSYNLNIFESIDSKIIDTGIVIFILSILESVESGYHTPSIIRLLKSGLFDMDEGDIMDLENYTKRYRIEGKKWKSSFTYGVEEYKEDILRLEELRKKVMSLFEAFDERINKETFSSFIDSFISFLDNDVNLKDRINLYIDKLLLKGKNDVALLYQQVYLSVINILSEIKDILPNEKFNMSKFMDILNIGLKEVKVNLIPPTNDSIVIGTMERLRLGKVKVLIVMGLNEGLIPMNVKKDTILSNDERELLKTKGFDILKTEKITSMEETLAIYRNMSAPLDMLYLTKSDTGTDGESINSSPIYDRILEILSDIEENSLNLDSSHVNPWESGLTHAINRLKDSSKDEPLDKDTLEILNWFKRNRNSDILRIKDELNFTNNLPSIGRDRAKALYGYGREDISLGPTSLEKYMRCPFKFFLSRGLNVREEKDFSLSPIEFGDMSHEVIKKFTLELSSDKLKPYDPNSRWNNISEEEISRLVNSIIDSLIDEYKEGIFKFSEEEMYEQERLRISLVMVCSTLVDQVRHGKIKEIFFETDFGRGKAFAPIKFDVDNESVFIEGRIDRCDILENDKVKIIDYKTGNEELNLKDLEAGFKIQLILYLKACCEDKRIPAAILYFHVRESLPSFDDKERKKITEEDIRSELLKSYKLNGYILNDDTVIDSIDNDFKTHSKIVKLSRTKEGLKGNILTLEEFQRITEDVTSKIYDGIKSMVNGDVNISPLKVRDDGNVRTACDNCEYMGICRFDKNIPGSNYRTNDSSSTSSKVDGNV